MTTTHTARLTTRPVRDPAHLCFCYSSLICISALSVEKTFAQPTSCVGYDTWRWRIVSVTIIVISCGTDVAGNFFQIIPSDRDFLLLSLFVICEIALHCYSIGWHEKSWTILNAKISSLRLCKKKQKKLISRLDGRMLLLEPRHRCTSSVSTTCLRNDVLASRLLTKHA